MDHESSRELVRRYRDGESCAAEEIHDRYVHRLIALARKRLSPKLAPRLDAEDIVQSAYRSFFVRARDGAFVFQRAGDLWRLLAQITLNKLRGQVERHSAKRRSVESEAAPDDLDWARDREPTADDVASAVEMLERVMSDLNRQQREVLELRLQGVSIPEIAEQVDRSQRTVRRLLQSIRSTMTHALGRYE